MRPESKQAMLPKADRIAFTVIGIVALLAFATVPFKDEIRSMVARKTAAPQVQSAAESNTADQNQRTKANPTLAVAQKWNMPAKLKEISGIAYVDAARFACVEDEEGKIYIYNTQSQSIEKEIPFAAVGDYEGIAIAGNTAYVLRADGRLYEVANYNNKPTVVEHQTHLTAKQDVEGLCYDQKNNRLLLAIKGNEPNTSEYKGIYAFDLANKKLNETPVLKIDLTHEIWKDIKSKQKIEPSDLDIHPLTGDIYITDGAKPKLLIMDAEGKKKNLLSLDETQFPQPEGVAFTPEGELMISSEGKTGTGSIVKVNINGVQ
ncbi:SdiA-regulated domain-containing protein [Flavisolibacter tropicus]|uniref:SdiA-regulated domain-containing protein n=1 Tax=Flavisolibacter tropicus TaxID=1492898 RepID=UPI00082EFAA1|nr:SdiA-regulated domain-containing protein [Flavisolibacter tropicus]